VIVVYKYWVQNQERKKKSSPTTLVGERSKSSLVLCSVGGKRGLPAQQKTTEKKGKGENQQQHG